MKELTSKDFKTAIAKGNTVIDFWAPWCGPCKMMGPYFEEAAKAHPTVSFAKLNVDESGDIAQELGIRGIPTMIFFKNGEEVSRSVGMLTKAQIEAKVKDTFGAAMKA